MKIACIIPARLDSTRFPKKILAPLNGKPLIQRTWEMATSTPHFSDVILAIDSYETQSVVQRFGGRSLMTSINHSSGTSRMIEVMQSGIIDADIWVNWQCDEPFITHALIDDLLQSINNKTTDIWTLKKLIENEHDITNPNVVKVVCDESENALYFSRSPIPFYRDNNKQQNYYKHVGIYAFTTKALTTISHLPPCELEMAEKLEQLRFLYHNLQITTHNTIHVSHDINIPQDLKAAETLICNGKLYTNQ